MSGTMVLDSPPHNNLAGNVYPLSQVKKAMVRIYLARESRFLESKTPTQVLESKENRFQPLS